ncbi:MAG TPA: DUF2252 family protein [Terriglobales bacterium]|nr:DUF2252 family protein [Terriglobales bacterium]
MRSAVDQILAFNGHFERAALQRKLERMLASPFTFFRATFHLFAYDLQEGWCRDRNLIDVEGPIIGDLHTENFGAFRAITGDIVYDINDFDEVTTGSYEIDLRRLTTSILLAALDNGHSFGEGVREAELAARSYLETVGRLAQVRDRKEFEKLTATREILRLLHKAQERSRVEFIKKIAVQPKPGRFAFRRTDRLRPLNDKVKEELRKAVPEFLAHVLAPPKARPTEYTLHDIAFRLSGVGSLGRARYALLFGKGAKEQDDWSTLRLIDWKESLISALDSREPRSSEKRAQEIFAFTRSFQLFPKRYLGFVTIGKQSMQTKEIGANDARFNPKQMQNPAHFQRAAQMFGNITARAHLLGSIGNPGLRPLVKKLHGREDRFVHKLLSFAVAYADRTFEDFDELTRRKAEVAQAWSAKRETLPAVGSGDEELPTTKPLE